MSELFEEITRSISRSSGINQLGRRVGTSEENATGALSAAFPVLLEALTKNASRPDEAESLKNAISRDHDGSILDSLDDLINDPDHGPGDGILGHIFGSKRSRVESSMGKSFGLDSSTMSTILKIAAPIIMGAIGRSLKSRGSVDSGSLREMLNNDTNEMKRMEPNSMSAIEQMLDTDGDGDVDMADLARSGLPKMLGQLFK
ncbi:MAG: hypothetical protein DHS20C13_04080 [Thermodesulfobacteriota bacterium]|nr:MAG: hypothetical protein DHS20C13_04080 [Thermodesulfobacteriota bacterium]